MNDSSRYEAALDLVVASAQATSMQAAAEAFASRILNVCDIDYAVYCEHASADDAPLRITPSQGFTPLNGTWNILVMHSRFDPWLQHVRATGNVAAARWDDFASPTDLNRNPMVCDLYRPAGTDHVLHAPIAWGPETNVMMTLSRQGRVGFTETDRNRIEILGRSLGHARSTSMIPLAPLWNRTTAGTPGTFNDQPEPHLPEHQSLTHRQNQVLALVAAGLTNQQVAYRLGLSTRTVDKHLENILSRLHVRNRAQAAASWARSKQA